MVQAAPEERLNRGGSEGKSRRAIFFSQLAIGRNEKKEREREREREKKETVATRRNGHSDRATPVRVRADRLTGSRVTLFPGKRMRISVCLCIRAAVQLRRRATARTRSASTLST